MHQINDSPVIGGVAEYIEQEIKENIKQEHSSFKEEIEYKEKESNSQNILEEKTISRTHCSKCGKNEWVMSEPGMWFCKPCKQIKIQEAKDGLSQCYEDITNFLGEWVDITDEQKKLISIWIVGTYFHKTFTTYPYLFFNAIKGSGKTRLLKIIAWLQANGNGKVMNNPSEAVLFRTAKERGLVLDEFESERSKDKQAMREYLNSCYKKGGEVFRMEKQKDKDGKEKQVAVGYDLFTPVCMANINGIEDVLGDRSITTILEKSNNPALVKKIEDFDYNPKIKHIKANLFKFSVELCSVYPPQKCIDGWNDYICQKYTPIHTIHTIHNSTQLYTNEDLDIYNKIDATGILGRNLELFFPLLLTARYIGLYIFDEILEIAKSLNTAKKDDEFTENKDITLIEFVSLADRYRYEYKFAIELFEEFKSYIGRVDDPNDNWLNITWFGSALKRLKLAEKKRVAKGQMLLLNVDKAKDKLKQFKNEDEKQ